MPTSATDKESITDAAAELQVAAAAYKSAHLGCNQTPCHGHSCYGNILGNIDAWKEFVRTHGGIATPPSKPSQRIDIFAANSTKGKLYTSVSTGFDEPWSKFVNIGTGLGAGAVKRLLAISIHPNRIDLFCGSDGTIKQRTRLEEWKEGWIGLATKALLIGVLPAGNYGVEIFCSTEAIYRNPLQLTTTEMEVPPWMSLGEFSDVSAQPVAGVAVSRGRNLYDIFSVGKDGALYSKSWSGLRWTPPLDGHVRYLKLGEGCVGAPAAVARHRDRIDVFVLDSDGKLLHKTWDGQEWNPPDLIFEVLGSPPGVSFGSQPALVARGSERFDLFIIGKNGNLYHKALGKSIWNPASGFRDLGGNFEPSFPPTVVLRGESMEIFLVGGKETERGGYHKSWNGVVDPSLSEYEPLGIWNCSGPIAAVVRNVEPHVE